MSDSSGSKNLENSDFKRDVTSEGGLEMHGCGDAARTDRVSLLMSETAESPKKTKKLRRRSRKSQLLYVCLLFGSVVLFGCFMTFLIASSINDDLHYFNDRSLHGHDPVVNCSPLAVKQFPEDLFTQRQRQHGAVLLHCFLVLYMFLGVAIVCDEFFVPTLDKISEALDLNADVAGATFMAIGSSTPELFASLIGVFIAKDDIGVGTIVGSAVFNIVFIVSMCALLTEAPIQLQWYPIVRDCGYYTISILALTFVMADNSISWYESVMMLSLYAVYILIMYKNEALSSFAISLASHYCPPCCCPSGSSSGYSNVPLSERGDSPLANGHPDDVIIKRPPENAAHLGDDDFDELEKELFSDGSLEFVKNGKHDVSNGGMKDDFARGEDLSLRKKSECLSEVDEDESGSLLVYPKGSSFWKKLMWLVSLPLNACLVCTLPDVNKPEVGLCKVMLSFVLCTCWIAGFSYILVWMVTLIGFTIGVPDTIMGLTLLAAGTSVPDAMASVIVARNGEGDMAISNTVGSNVFDILICLGLPWAFKAFDGPCVINSSGLTYISFTLLTTVMLIMLIFMWSDWTLNKRLGVFLLLVYFVFVLFASLIESNVFGYVNPPPCAA